MDRFQAMETYVRVIEAGSFRMAAETMHALPSTVTRTIKELEAHLGIRLLNRTTRALSVTDAGLCYYDSCKAILRDVQAAEGATALQTGILRGNIRISATPSLAKGFIIPALWRFAERHPGIDLDFDLSDATLDVIQRGIDCAIRTGVLPPSRLIARQIGSFQWYVCGSPGYFERHGTPCDLDALRLHRAVGYVNSQTGRSMAWSFLEGGETKRIDMIEHVRVNDTDAYVCACTAGLGLIRVASYMVHGLLAEGRLVRVLGDIDTPREPISIVYPQSRHLSPAIRAFIDWCIDRIGKEAQHW
ncbi:LysR family transcriptional regulator [Alcaligenaceae bacterium SJ-26]|nr:LysR family transcriptional regulator [Alcaligenaceae bacterium SJ-26]